MRLLAIPLVASLFFARDIVRTAPEAAPAPPPPPAPVAVEEPEEIAGQVLAPPPVAAIRETDAAVPRGVVVKLHRAADGGYFRAELRRGGYLVALRRGDERAAGEGVASIPVVEGDEPVIWETTKLDTLATARGTLRIEGGAARIRMAEPPVAAAGEQRRLHTCVSHEDGAGGFTVICGVRSGATAASVTGGDPKAGVFGAGTSPRVVRMDLPAPSEGVEARVLGYSAGIDGVVIRAEATRAAGEDRASLAILSSDRPQPMVPRRTFYKCCCVF
jgi:hypothetical protein